jgi:hypothetical protein
MSDINQHDGAGELSATAPASIGEALRALPQATPPAGGWAEMALKIRDSGLGARDSGVRRMSRRNYWPVGIAAALVLAISAATYFRLHPTQNPLGETSSQTAATQPAAAASSVYDAANSTYPHDAKPDQSAQLAALQSRSRDLEQWLRDTGRAALPQSPQDLAASAEIEDMIGFVDVQLGATNPGDANTTLPLWQRRVALLEDLSTLRYSANAAQFQSGLAAN